MTFPVTTEVQSATLTLLSAKALALAQRLLLGRMVAEQIAAELAALERLLAQAKGPER